MKPLCTVRLAALVAVLVLAAISAPSAGAFTVRGSVEQVQLTGAAAGQRLALVNRRGRRVQSLRASALGGIVFRNVAPGRGYRIRTTSGSRSRSFRVLSTRSKPPSAAIYNQTLPAGYGYLTTRDGTQLAVNVQLPGPADKGPYPTLVEYAGYGYADPAGAESGIAPIAELLGYAVVDVNMRGTGCSGGAFDYFEPLQGLDGYDVVETVARQPWVAHHKVGMMGISYGGMSQLFVAATDPPSLASIAPLSVIDDTATTLYPGGILNTGFALSWAKDRVHDALPASATGGQPWALKQIQQGDLTCRANQVLHGNAVNLLRKIAANPYYVPSVADPLAPLTFVHKIKVPVFMACQWTDEQTGGHCADLAAHLSGTQRKWFTFTNGTHIDSLDPATFTRWFDFLELFVAQRPPALPPIVKAFAPTIFKLVMGVPDVSLPSDPIQSQPSYPAALAAYEQLPRVRVMFDNGAGGSTAGGPVAAFEQGFPRFPLPGTRARSWYLRANGALSPNKPSRAGADRFTENRAARPPTDFTGDTSGGPGGLWTARPGYNWVQPPAGSALSYVTSPLSANTTVIGPGALQTWIRSPARYLDLQATVSEVRPDGKETFVQSGWLRSDARRLDPRKSTLLAPVPTLARADAAPLPKGRWAPITVPLYYEGHVYRALSRIRITISAPGGDQPIWAFGNAIPLGPTPVTLARAPSRPSRLILPAVAGVTVPTGLPPCPGLRGEPCRTYRPLVNQPG